MKKVLITGATGFIGSNMIKYLLDNTDFIVYGIDNGIGGTENKKFILDLMTKNPKRFFFIPDDFVNFNFESIKIKYVYHFAAIPSVPYSVEFPYETDYNNSGKTVKFLKLCSDFKVEKFIFSSSSSIYGDCSIVPTPESVNDLTKSPYALQKLTIEKYCKIWSELYNLETICLRYFNVYGPNQYSNNAYSSVISSWIKQMLKNNPIRIDGDGSQKRSFTYVEDICKANLFFSNLDFNFNGKPINISDKNSITLLEIKELVSKILNKKPEINWEKNRPGDIHISQAETSFAESFGYKTSWSLEEGLKKTIDWYKNNL
jgi:nucleoside-diphosphate-sugar epimerase